MPAVDSELSGPRSEAPRWLQNRFPVTPLVGRQTEGRVPEWGRNPKGGLADPEERFVS